MGSPALGTQGLREGGGVDGDVGPLPRIWPSPKNMPALSASARSPRRPLNWTRMRVSATGPRSQSSGGSIGGLGRPRTVGPPLGVRARRGSRRRTGKWGSKCGGGGLCPSPLTCVRATPSAPAPPAAPQNAPVVVAGEGGRERDRRAAAGVLVLRVGQEESRSWAPQGPRAPSRPAAAGRAVAPSAHLQPTDVREALRPRRRPFLPRGSELHSHGGEQVFPDVRPPVGLGGQAFQMCSRSEPGPAGGGAPGWGLLRTLTRPHPRGLSRSQHPTGRGQGPSSARELQARGPVASRVAGAPLGHLPSPPRPLKQPRALPETPPVTPPPLPIHAQSQLPGRGPAPGVALCPRPPSRPRFPSSVSGGQSTLCVSELGAGAAGWPVHRCWGGCSPAGPVRFVPDWPPNSRGHYSSSVDPPALARPPCPPHLPGLL